MVRMLTGCNPSVELTTASLWRIFHSSSPTLHGDPDMRPPVLGMQQTGPIHTQRCPPGHSRAHREPIGHCIRRRRRLYDDTLHLRRHHVAMVRPCIYLLQLTRGLKIKDVICPRRQCTSHLPPNDPAKPRLKAPTCIIMSWQWPRPKIFKSRGCCQHTDPWEWSRNLLGL